MAIQHLGSNHIRQLLRFLYRPSSGISNGITPGDHIFFLGKNLYGNTSCVSNVFFLKKNEKFISRKNIIKMKHFIHIFFLQKIVYFTEIKMFEKYYIFPCQFF